MLIGIVILPVVQAQTTHSVQRGETFELIAARYGLTVSELQQSNPDEPVCYTGLKLFIPEGKTQRVLVGPMTSYETSLIEQASNLYKQGKYKKAASFYSDVLKTSSSAVVYFGRGMCYYKRGKYKDAIKDLSLAMNAGDCTDEIMEQCEDILSSARSLRQQQKERRNEAWAKIGFAAASVAAVAATAYAVSEQNKAQQAYMNQYNVRGGAGSSSLSRADAIIAQSNAYNAQMRAQGTAQLDMMTQNMMIHAEQAKQRLIQSEKELLEWSVEFEKTNGRYPTLYEKDQWYAAHYPDLMESRIMARGKMNSELQDDDDNKKEDIRIETDYSEKFKTRYSSGKECVFCLGSGNCKTCGGRGYYYSSYNLSEKVLCPNCDYNHNGVCSHCHGTKVNP